MENMSTLNDLVAQSEYIADKKCRLENQWHSYHSTLIRAVTLSNKKINHQFTCSIDNDIRFKLFNHFTVCIHLDNGFYNQNIAYRINLNDASEAEQFLTFAHATLDENNKIDEQIDINNQQEVFQHYLNKIQPIYQCIFDALQSKQPITAALKKLLNSI